MNRGTVGFQILPHFLIRKRLHLFVKVIFIIFYFLTEPLFIKLKFSHHLPWAVICLFPLWVDCTSFIFLCTDTLGVKYCCGDNSPLFSGFVLFLRNKSQSQSQKSLFPLIIHSFVFSAPYQTLILLMLSCSTQNFHIYCVPFVLES